jgi:hypothetical protein
VNLILHIGAGKTGTTSIQNVLLANEAIIREQGFKYIGLMLENAYSINYSWQMKTTVNTDFFSMPQEKACDEACSILSDTFHKAEKEGIHTLIWSNESFFDNSAYLIPIIKKVQSEGINVTIVAYVRNYESWAKSAYIQWGIKHKTYKGRLKTFKEWVVNQQPSFSKKLEPYFKNFSEHLVLRNMDALIDKDVVKDFLSLAAISNEDIASIKTNIAPESEELLLRALFNSTYPAQVLPVRFNNMFEYFHPTFYKPKAFLEKLLPSVTDLEDIEELISEDRANLNRYLQEQSQPLIQPQGSSVKEVEVDKDRLLMLMAQLTMGQSRRIDKLETRIKNLEESVR